jgi:hypothetical protein
VETLAYSFIGKIRNGCSRRTTKQVSSMIGEHMVMFLGHFTIARAQTSFYMSKRNMKFDCG